MIFICFGMGTATLIEHHVNNKTYKNTDDYSREGLVPQELPSVQMPATNGVTSLPIVIPGNYKFGVPIDVYVSPQIHMLEPTRLFYPWDFLGKNTGMGCHFLLQRIFPTQGLNPGLLHCRQILYHLSHLDSQ